MPFRNVTFKFLAFLLLSSAVFGIFLLYRSQQPEGILSAHLYFGILFYALSILAFFLATVSWPLVRIVHQVKFLLNGKKYHRIKPFAHDEIGIMTHFFNKITLNLESISTDIAETKRLTSELDVARKIQKDILPSRAPSILGLDIVARSRPAAEMGGDSFDILQQDYHCMMYIGDVTGHGVGAGLVMTMVNTLIHAFTKSGMMPYEILTQVNAILHERISAPQFMSLVMLRWDEKRQKMYYLGAGHEYILVYRAEEKKVERIRTGGVALKMAPEIGNYIEEKNLDLGDNDVVVLYTDGITEGKNPEGEMYQVTRLAESLEKHGARASAAKIFDALTQDFSKFMGDYINQDDDITMIVIKKLPPGEQVPTPIKLTIGGLEETVPERAGKQWEWEK